MSDDEWDRCWRTNVLGVKQLVAASMPTFNSNAEGGVVLVTSSIAGRSIAGSSMPYSVTKAAQLHLVKCVAKTQGSKVRCNAVLPGLLLTEWGMEFGEERIKALKEAAVLKQEVSLYCFTFFLLVVFSFERRAEKAYLYLSLFRLRPFFSLSFLLFADFLQPADRSPRLRRHVRLAREEHEHHRPAHPGRLRTGDPAPLDTNTEMKT